MFLAPMSFLCVQNLTENDLEKFVQSDILKNILAEDLAYESTKDTLCQLAERYACLSCVFLFCASAFAIALISLCEELLTLTHNPLHCYRSP